jgi:hypothetical protein
MTEPSRDSKSPQTETEKEKKVPETVLLSSEELRAIAGGKFSGVNPPGSSGKVEINPLDKPHRAR